MMTILRFLRDAWVAVLIACLLMAITSPARADQPPRELFIEVTSTSQLVHQGECDMSRLGMDDARCLVYANPSHFWLVLFDGAEDAPQVSIILRLDAETREPTVAWCREDVCK